MSEAADDEYWKGEMQGAEDAMERLESRCGPCVYCVPVGWLGSISFAPCSPECQALDDIEAEKEERTCHNSITPPEEEPQPK